MRLPRRSILGRTAAAVLAVAGPLSGGETAGSGSTGSADRALRHDPFTLGVASGDPEPDSVVLWTRLAPEPLAHDGHGGMPERPLEVSWQLAADPQCRQLVREGVSVASPEWAHSVHVEVDALEPDTEYWYRFRLGRHVSPLGRTRTAPHPASLTPLLLGVVAGAQFERGYFTGYRHLVDDGVQVVAHLGGYVYPAAVEPPLARSDHRIPAELHSLRDYRLRHAQYKSDPDLQYAHAAAPWLLTWDDHEVCAGYANLSAGQQPGFGLRRAAAYRAYYEHLPLRRSSMPRGQDMPIYRTARWGRLADLHLLDTRQYREPGRTMLGHGQDRWLAREIGRRRARWDVLVQPAGFAQGRGGWDECADSRERVVEAWRQAGVCSPIVLSRHPLPGAEPAVTSSVATELSVGSVSAGEGYLLCRVDPDRWHAEYRGLDTVSEPGGTGAMFSVKHAHPVHNNVTQL